MTDELIVAAQRGYPVADVLEVRAASGRACWELRAGDGSLLQWDVFPHYSTAGEAVAAVEGHNRDYDVDGTDGFSAVLLAAPCVEPECRVCAVAFEYDDVCHFGPEQLDLWMDDSGWGRHRDGSFTCPDHTDVDDDGIPVCEGQEVLL